MAVAARSEERVTPLELFFDLVFVFAITQVTSLVSNEPTWQGLGKGLLVLVVLWWAWAAYAWLTSTVDPEDGIVRLAMFGAMAAMLVASLSVPGAFGGDAVVFAAAYTVVRLAHLGLYALAGRGDPELLHAVATIAPTSLASSALLFGATALDGAPQAAVWVAAVVIDLGGPFVSRGRGWHLAAGHFAERHGLIVIIAIGESIVAVGVGTHSIDAGVVLAAVLALTIAAALWWAYFDVVALVAERKLRGAEGAAQARLARDSYSYLHFPMVAGIIFFALGVKKTLLHVDDPLDTVPAVALCGGVALYLLAHVAFRLRNVRTLSRRRLVVAAVLVALIPAATSLPALATVAVVAGLAAGLIAYETVRFAEARDRVRHALEAG